MAKFRQPPNSVAEATIISKSITANGTYNASSDSADGYNPVTVAVPEKTIVSKSITANGTYNASSDNADGYNPVIVNVESIDGMIFGESDPSSSQGVNGDYYYKRLKSNEYGYTAYTPGTYFSNTAIYGQEITPVEDIVIKGLRLYVNHTREGYTRIGDLTDIIKNTTAVNMVANAWNEMLFDEPITLQANTKYIIQGVMNSSPGGIAYKQSSSGITINSKITNQGVARYGSYPGTSESGVYVGIDIIIASDLYRITDQYIKVNNIWTPIT